MEDSCWSIFPNGKIDRSVYLLVGRKRVRKQMSQLKTQRVFNGEQVLLPIALALLFLSALLAISVVRHWPRIYKEFGVYGLFLSPAFLMVSCWEIWRYQHRWRTLLASVVLLLATVVGWATVALRVAVGL